MCHRGIQHIRTAFNMTVVILLGTLPAYVQLFIYSQTSFTANFGNYLEAVQLAAYYGHAWLGMVALTK